MKGVLAMENINKFQSFMILLMVAIGIFIGQFDIIRMYSEYLVMPALMIMLFLVFLQFIQMLICQ